jgi:hypothetical protein
MRFACAPSSIPAIFSSSSGVNALTRKLKELGCPSMIVGIASDPLTYICSIIFRYALSSISESFYFSSVV